MKRIILAIGVVLVSTLTAICAAQNTDGNKREAELVALRQLLDLTRDSLQNDIAQRWRAKQKYVEQREIDKEELSRLKDIQERVFAQASRVKEECFSKEKTVEEDLGATSGKQEEWRVVTSTVDDVLAKESQLVLDGFPLDCENRKRDVESIRRKFQKKQDATIALNEFLDYCAKYVRIGSTLAVVKQTVLPNDGKPRLLSLARFGNVFAYGMDEKGELYFIRQSGKLGADRFSIDKIEDPAVCATLRLSLPQWVASGIIGGSVPTDVLQNDQTKLIIAGKKTTRFKQFVASIKAGGAVMVPLLLLPVWATILVILKLVQFGARKSRYAQQYKTVSGFIENNQNSQALAFCQKSKGAMARIFERCLSDPNLTRSAIEKAIKEILMGEIPELSRYLNTLAVIAGAAPLLGLLGTISGMISLFAAVTHYGTGDPKFLAGGISEALITAKTGLAVAIPALFIHDYLRNKKDQIQASIEKYSFRILNKLWPEG